MKQQKVTFNKIFAIPLMTIILFCAFTLCACDEDFRDSITIKQNAANTASDDMQYTMLTVKARQQVYINWQIDEHAQNSASAYKIVVVDNDKNALTQDNNITSLSVYDQSKKSLGTATTTTPGQYSLGAILGDNTISAGRYYAILVFAHDGTYNICLNFLE